MTLLKRIFSAGLKSFYRNKVVSLSSIFILTITLSIIASIFFFKAVFNYTIAQVQSKVDIIVYFKPEATDESILSVRKSLQDMPEVKSITFTSREDVLTQFRTQHAGDEVTLAALDEINDNPFGATLAVQANETDQYAAIASRIGIDDSGKVSTDGAFGVYAGAVDKANYSDLKDQIANFTALVKWMIAAGYILTLVFVLVSLMIIFNTTRLAIFTFRDEISVMKLVGASNMYIRGPFIVESAFFGLIAAIIAILICWPITYWLGQHTTNFFEGLNLFEYFKSNFLILFAVLAASGIIVSVISSILAVRRYLRV